MKRILAFILPLVAGIAVLIALTMSRQSPEQAPLAERSVPVRVIRVPSVDMVPRTRAYGVEPNRTWNAVAEVGGKIVEINPEAGAFLPADSVLVRIDPADYELEVAQRRADIEAVKAQLRDNEVVLRRGGRHRDRRGRSQGSAARRAILDDLSGEERSMLESPSASAPVQHR